MKANSFGCHHNLDISCPSNIVNKGGMYPIFSENRTCGDFLELDALLWQS